jgi:hypothetical protein
VWVLLQDAGDQWSLEQSPELQERRAARVPRCACKILDADGRPEVAISWSGEADPLLDPKACPGDGSLRGLEDEEACVDEHAVALVSSVLDHSAFHRPEMQP